jgi:hypothetical protein
MLETCPICKSAVLFTNDRCPSCGRSSLASERVPTTLNDLAPAMSQPEQKLVGISGWLILPAIGLVLSLIATPIGLVAGLAGKDIQLYPAYKIPSLLVNAGFYFVLWAVAILFFKKRSTVPRILIQFMAARVLASVVLFVVGLLVVGGGDELVIIALLRSYNFIAQGIAAAIWIPYLKKSERVKATFTK